MIDDDFNGDDFLDDEWVEDDDSEDVLLACPSCGQSVHEETQQCPHCGDWIIPVYPSRPLSRWLVVGITVLLVGAMVLLTVL